MTQVISIKNVYLKRCDRWNVICFSTEINNRIENQIDASMGYTLISSSVDMLSDFLSRRKLIQPVFKKNASLRKFKYKFGSLKCFMRSMVKSTEVRYFFYIV